MDASSDLFAIVKEVHGLIRYGKPQGQSYLSISVNDNKSLQRHVDDFWVSVQATKESGMRVLPIYAPRATYLALEGGETLIHSVELRGTVRSYFLMVAGTPADEKGSDGFLYAPENFPRPANTGGRILKETDSNITTSTRLAAIQISPFAETLKDEQQFAAHICYKISNGIKNSTSVKFFDINLNQYIYLGFLSVEKSRRCDDFPLPKSAVLSTLGRIPLPVNGMP